MTAKTGYYDGIEVTLSDDKQSVRKRLYADGENSVSMHGVTVSITHDSFSVGTSNGGGGSGGIGGGPSKPAIVTGPSGAPGSGRPIICFEDGVIGHPLTKL